MASSSPSPKFPPVTVAPNSSDPPMRRRLAPAENPTSNSSPPSPSPPPATSSPPSSPPVRPTSATEPPTESPSTPPPSTEAPSTPPPTPTSPPPPSEDPPASPPPTEPPPPSPPPPSQNPPASPPPTPSTNPPSTSPPPSTPQPQPPQTSSPPPATQTPQTPTPSAPGPPNNSPPQSGPPTSSSPSSGGFSPPPPLSPPSQGPPSNSSSPPGTVVNPPPPSSSSNSSPTNSSSPTVTPPFTLSPPSTTQIPVLPSGNSNNNGVSPNTPSRNGGTGTGGIVAAGVVAGLVLLGVIALAIWCTIRRKRKSSGVNGPLVMPTTMGSSPASDSKLLKGHRSGAQVGSQQFMYSPENGGLGNSRAWFTYEELTEATNGFSEQNLLGSGGFGSVYKGCLPDGTEVAVKELNIGGGQGEREFRAEVDIISRIHHRYLVSLVGYCISDNKRLLVYEYVANNTLYFHLHRSELGLDWSTRVRIAIGAARGIAYLHEDCQPRIIHRDIKSANILLDRNFNARVADFGLAKLAGDASSHVTTRVVGTFGYMAPEYAQSGKLTDKSDIFSFGVVLLELVTGRKPVDASRPLGQESLVEWSRPLLTNALEHEEFEELIDPRLGKNYIGNEMFRMIEAAAACVRHSALKRPRMGQVVRAFENMETDDLTNGMRVGESGMFNAAQQSAEFKLFRRMAFGGSQDYSSDFFSQGSYSSR